MKTASMVLGIVGGALAIIGGLCMIFLIVPMMPTISSSISGLDGFSDYAQSGEITDMAFNVLTTVYTVLGICICTGGVLGLVGGIIVKKNNIAGGVLMIIGTVVGCLNLLILVGAILAFIREKKPVPQYAPYTPYPPYPGQPQYMPQNPPYPGQQPYAPQNPSYPNQTPYAPQNPQYPGQQPYANPSYPVQPQDPPQDKTEQ